MAPKCLLTSIILTFCALCFAFDGSPGRSLPLVQRGIGGDRQQQHRGELRRDTPGASATTETSSFSSTLSPSGLTPSATASLALPRPFDSILGENFTSSACPNFLNNYFTTNETLQACVPFSLLLQNSKAFFQASKLGSTLTAILDASCKVSSEACSTLMDSLAKQILSTSVCGNDYELGNPFVVKAYNGLVSYLPMYRAGCLKADPSEKSDGLNFPYCYVSAINSSAQADSGLYQLPLGAGIPAGSSVSCSTCNQKTMAIFAESASEASSPLNKDYIDAASAINQDCGAGFVNQSTSILSNPSRATKSGAKRTLDSHLAFMATSIIAAILLLAV